MFQKLFKHATLFHLILIAVIAALGIAVRPIVVPLAQLITGPIPGGAAAGAIYMLFLVLAAALTKVRGAGLLCGLVQALLVMTLGIAGSHGVMSLVTFTLPGIAVDLVFFIAVRKHKPAGLLACFFAGMLANIAGTVSVNFVFFSLPWVPLLLSLSLAAFSGGVGGVAAFAITKQLQKRSVTE